MMLKKNPIVGSFTLRLRHRGHGAGLEVQFKKEKAQKVYAS